MNFDLLLGYDDMISSQIWESLFGYVLNGVDKTYGPITWAIYIVN